MSRMELTRRANPLGVVHLTDLRPVAAAARLFSERFSPAEEWRTKGVKNMEEKKHQELDIHIEELEPKVAPSIPPGQHGYEGQPGNQGAHNPGEVTIHH